MGDPFHHEGILHVNDDQRRPHRIEVGKHMLAPAACNDPIDDFLRNQDLMHHSLHTAEQYGNGPTSSGKEKTQA